MKKAVISLSIDDARTNVKNLIYEKLLPLKIPATLNVITGFIDKTKENKGYPCITKEELLNIYNTGIIEIANHSDGHTNDLEDIKLGHDKLCEWLNLDKKTKLGFASSGSNLKIDKANLMKKQLQELGVLYVRTEDSLKIAKPEELRKKYLLGDENAYIKLQKHAFKEIDDFAFSSLVLYKGVNDLRELKLLTDYAVKTGKNLTIMIHNLSKQGEEIYNDAWTFDFDVFSEYLYYIDNLRNRNEIEILTVADSLKKGNRV
ncbi:MAG: polysaccharide deacetylase family protein [Clostridia bacterium]|nr:polysaccharide deacetylase family protein [Clostridia bacterium]